MRTAKETFYFVDDVMKMLGLSRSKAYSIIKQFNSELEEQGYFTVPGRVNRRYFDSRMNYEPEPKSARKRARTA